jgi:large subunit ribosomal protein L17
LEHERIRTTVQKAKEVRPLAEKMITLGKKETLHARRQAARFLLKAAVVQKLFDSIAARYSDRPGGYTRILKLGPRAGDGAELAIIELISGESEKKPKALGSKGRGTPKRGEPKAGSE